MNRQEPIFDGNFTQNFRVIASKLNKLFGISRYFVTKNNLRGIAMGIGPIGEEAFLPFIVS